MRALVVAVVALAAGCSAPAAQPRQPPPPVVAAGDLDYQWPPGWSEDKLRVLPIANRTGGPITYEFFAAWKALVAPAFDVTQPTAPYRRRLTSGYALAYGGSSVVALYIVYTDDRYVAILTTGTSAADEPALIRIFDTIEIRGVPPSKTPLFTVAEISGHWSTTGARLGPDPTPGEELVLQPKGHFEWYFIGAHRNTAAGLWGVNDDILAREGNYHDMVRRRIWAHSLDALLLVRDGLARPPFFPPNDSAYASWFKSL